MKATYAGILEIGDSKIPCYVLENGERILSTRGIMEFLGRTWRGRKCTGTKLPLFLEETSLKSFINNEQDPVLVPVKFKTDKGAQTEGYRAEILPLVCEIYLRARDENKLTSVQKPVAIQCDILTRALAHVGVIALVDEATGYQKVRDRKALQALLDKYLREELAAWAKRFPDEFYQEMFRLRGWQWQGMKVNRPSMVGKYTTDIVYERLAPGVLKELEARNPEDNKGQRNAKHHQWLTEDIGSLALSQHLYAVIGLMRASPNWDRFKRMLQRAFPKKGHPSKCP